MCQNTHHRMSRVNAQHQTQPWFQGASRDRQAEILSSLVREDFQKTRQTNIDCRFRIFIWTDSPTQQHLLVGR